jgi:hypothetical protein
LLQKSLQHAIAILEHVIWGNLILAIRSEDQVLLIYT